MRANAPQLPGGGGMGAAGIDWCINMTYISPMFLALFRDVFKKATKITVLKFSKNLKVKIA